MFPTGLCACPLIRHLWVLFWKTLGPLGSRALLMGVATHWWQALRFCSPASLLGHALLLHCGYTTTSCLLFSHGGLLAWIDFIHYTVNQHSLFLKWLVSHIAPAGRKVPSTPLSSPSLLCFATCVWRHSTALDLSTWSTTNTWNWRTF